MVTYILALSILIQFSVTAVAILLARRQTNVFWYFISLAMFLAGLRRCVTLYSGIKLGQNVEVLAEVVALAISLLALTGVVGVFRATIRLPKDQDLTSWPEKTDTIRRLTRTGFLLGVVTVVASVIVGYSSFIAGQEAAYQKAFDSNLALVRTLASEADRHPPNESAKEILAHIGAITSDIGISIEGGYVCAIARDGTLTLHTGHPERVGKSIGHIPIQSETFKTIGELALSDEDWVGHFTSTDGEEQIVAAAHSSVLDTLLMVHVPKASIDAAYNTQALPWSIGLAVLILFLFPMSLGFLRTAFVTTLKNSSMATQALQESEARYRLLADHVSDVIFAVDLDLNFTYISSSFERMTGHSTHDVENIPIQSIMTPESLQRIQNYIQYEIKEDGEGVDPNRSVILQLDLVRLDGRIVPVETKVAYTRDSAGQPIGFVGVTRDISERVEAEKQRNALEEQLQHSQKMEAVGTLAGGIAHDFNNILQAILGFSDMAQNSDTTDDNLERCLEEISSGAARGAELVKQILTFSRSSEVKYTSIDLQEPLKESLKLLRGSLPSTIDIHTEISDVSPVFGNSTQIHQIIMNLCTNAYQAMENTSGTLDLSLKDTVVSSDVAAASSDLNEGKYVLLTVRDTGYGIAPENLRRIFDPFFTTKETGKGTGLGLSVIHGIVKNMGGVIHVQSVEGEGTTFEIYWPAYDMASVQSTSEILVSRDEQTTGKEHILFVDDEASIVNLVQMAFEKKGFQVEAYTSSSEALQAFRERQDEYDIVITDLTMPDMNGKELADGIHMLNKDIPILLCTGMGEYDKNPTELERIGIVECLSKPLIIDDLCRAIGRHCNRGETG